MNLFYFQLVKIDFYFGYLYSTFAHYFKKFEDLSSEVHLTFFGCQLAGKDFDKTAGFKNCIASAVLNRMKNILKNYHAWLRTCFGSIEGSNCYIEG